MLRDGRFLKTYSIDSAPQQIPNMTLTVTTIKVTRFRILVTACNRGMQILINILIYYMAVSNEDWEQLNLRIWFGIDRDLDRSQSHTNFF